MKKKNAALCILFFAVLCSFWMADVLLPDRLYSDWEKRMLAQKPDLSWSAVVDGSYGKKYEEWLLDQFPARDWWVNIKTRCELLLGKKEIQGVYLGKDGYLFSENRATTDWDELEAKLQAQFGSDRVSRIHVPAAGAILEDKLPDPIRFSGTEGAVKEALLAHRDEYIYFRTDHHWTMLGAYYAYEGWARERGMVPLKKTELERRVLRENFLGTHYGKLHYAPEPDTLELYAPEISCEAVYDLGTSPVTGLYQEQHLAGEDAYRYFLDGNHGLVEITTGHKGGHLAVLKDSFANNFIPFLTAHYEQITVIDPRYFRMDMAEWLSEQGITEILILAQDAEQVCFEEI